MTLEPDRDEDIPGAFRRITFLDRAIRFLFGAIPAAVGMFALIPLFGSPDFFFSVTGFVAVMAGLATAIWGDRFLLPLLRAIRRLAKLDG